MRNRHIDPTPVAREVRREDDGELVGLLLSVGAAWVPATVFGSALAPATDAERAESVVREHGLSSLADRWWVRTASDEPWREAWLLEVKPDRLRLRWNDPMLMQGGHGEWHRVADLDIQRHRP
ncbi:MAG: hypothetical protein ABIW80_03975 [Lapillicoccus sp.]